MSSLVVDQGAVGTLANAVIEDDWFDAFALPKAFGNLRRVKVGDDVYILSQQADEQSHLLVIRVGAGGVFDNTPSAKHVFSRILHIALIQFERTVSLPVAWKPFHQG